MARYLGPLYWNEPGKPSVAVALKPPAGAKAIDHVALASPGRVVVLWATGRDELLIPVVHSSSTGAPLAVCPPVSDGGTTSSEWVPDPAGKVAAFGECLIRTGDKTFLVDDFRPLSFAGGAFYGESGDGPVRVVPGGAPVKLAEETARPWGVAGGRAIVVHESVLYALERAIR